MRFNRPYFSYSSWSLYDACPLSYKFRYVDKLPGGTSAAMDRGTMIHALAENFVNGKITGLPTKLKLFSKEFASIRKAKAQTELTRYADVYWKPSGKDTGWTMAKLDANLMHDEEAVVIDYKTGGIYADKHTKQGSLYAVLEWVHNPDVDNVHVEFWYLDKGKVLSWDYGRAALDEQQRLWTERGVEVLTAEKFPAKPSEDACKWCAYHKKNGGPCKEGY